MALIEGEPLLGRLLARVSRSQLTDALVVATSDQVKDDVIAQVSAKRGAFVYRGSETDVLDRLYQAVRPLSPDVVVRLTADNPLVDGTLVDESLQMFARGEPQLDYLDTTRSGTFPYGLSVEVVTWLAIKKAWEMTSDAQDREHVTRYVLDRPSQFRLFHWALVPGAGEIRLTVDTPEDLERIRQLAASIPGLWEFSWREIIAVLKPRLSNPQ